MNEVKKLSESINKNLISEIYKDVPIIYIGNFEIFHEGHVASLNYLNQNFKYNPIYLVHFSKKNFTSLVEKNKLVENFKLNNAKIYDQNLIKQFSNTSIVFAYDEETKTPPSENFEKINTINDLKINSKNYYFLIPETVNNISTNLLSKKIFDFSVPLNEKIKLFFESYPNASIDLFYSILPKLEKMIVSEWIQSSKINEISSTGRIGSDDGPIFMYRNYDSYKKSSPHKLKKFLNTGWNIVKYMIDDDKEIPQSFAEYPNGPVASVSFYPAGDVKPEQYSTAHNQDNFIGNKAYKLWRNHVLKIIASLGWEWINDREEKKDIVSQTSDKLK